MFEEKLPEKVDLGEDIIMNEVEIINPQLDHLPVVLMLDASGSMEGEPINELNNGLNQLFKEFLADNTISKCVDLMIISYGGGVNVEVPFTTLENIQFKKEFVADGGTPMAEATFKAIDEVKNLYKYYRKEGINTYPCIVINITDGKPNSSDSLLNEAKETIINYESNLHLLRWNNLGTRNANMNFLNSYGVRKAKLLSEVRFLDLLKYVKIPCPSPIIRSEPEIVELPDINWIDE